MPTKCAFAATDTSSAARWRSRSRLIPRTNPHHRGAQPAAEPRELRGARTGIFFGGGGRLGRARPPRWAALIEKINNERTEHIVTIEDPIEYIFENKKSLIDQREVRVDTSDFSGGAAIRLPPGRRRRHDRRDAHAGDYGHGRHPPPRRGHLVFSTPPHQQRRADHRPHHRLVPRAAAGADPHPARRILGGDILAAPRAPGIGRIAAGLRAFGSETTR